MPWLKDDFRCGEPGRCPRKQHVDGNKGRVIVIECLTQLCPKHTECAHVFGYVAPDGGAQRKARDAGGESPRKTVLLGLRGAVNNIKSLFQPREESRDFFRRMLQIVI